MTGAHDDAHTQGHTAVTIGGVPVADFGPQAILGLVVVLILTDKLVWHKRLQERDKRIAALEDTVKNLTEQNGVMLKATYPTVDAVLTALHDRANEVSP